MVARVLAKLIGWRLRGDHQRSALFDAATGQPLARRACSTPAERERAQAALRWRGGLPRRIEQAAPRTSRRPPPTGSSRRRRCRARCEIGRDVRRQRAAENSSEIERQRSAGVAHAPSGTAPRARNRVRRTCSPSRRARATRTPSSSRRRGSRTAARTASRSRSRRRSRRSRPASGRRDPRRARSAGSSRRRTARRSSAAAGTLGGKSRAGSCPTHSVKTVIR